MKNTLTVLLATAAVSLFPADGSAQEWSGPYAGVALGYSFGDAIHSFSNLTPSGNSSPSGVLAGGFLGYGFQSGNMVYGGEVDVDFNGGAGSFIDLTGATSGGTTEGVWQASVRGVVGYAAELGNKPALYYATAGWATGGFDFMGGPSASPTNPYSDTLSGWAAGVGVDWRLSETTTMRLEYRYTDFGTASGSLDPGYPGVTMPVEVTQSAIRVGIRMDF